MPGVTVSQAGTADHVVRAVRTAGIATSALQDLHGAETSRALRRIIDLDREIKHDGTRLADLLFRIIGDIGAGQVRSRLVALRRALHRGVHPKPVVWNADLALTVGPGIAAEIEYWCALLTQRALAVASLPSLVAADTAKCVESVRTRTRDPYFHHGLATASAATATDADRWLAHPDAAPSRRLLTTLVGYLSRAGAKTSPFSTFMVSATGSAEGEVGGRPDIALVLEPKALFVEKARSAVLDQPQVRDAVRLRVNPSLRSEPDHLEFLGARPLEAIVRLPRSAEVDAVLVAAQDTPTRLDLVGLVAAEADAPADVVDRFVSLMLEANVLEAISPAPDQSPSPFADLADWWTDATGNEDDDVPRLLRTVDSAIRGAEPHRPGPATRVRHRHALLAAQELCDALTPDAVTVPRPSDGDHLLHETAVDRTRRPVPPVERWAGDLDLVCRWLAPFDLTLPLRLVAARRFERWFGADAEVPFLRFHRAVQEWLGEASSPSGPEPLSALLDLAGPDTPRLAELNRWKRSALALVAPERTGGGVAAAEVAEEVSSRPTWLDLTGASLSCYTQIATATSPLLVVNAITPGHGRGGSRVLRLVSGCADLPAAEGTPRVGTVAEPLRLDLSGTFGSALNLRLLDAEGELHYPGTEPAMPPGDRIRLSELTVALDADRGQLVVRAGGRGVVQPRHTGMMSVLLLPPAARLLVQVFGPPGNFPPPWAVFGTSDSWAPRVRLGDVVLRRAQARVPAPALRRAGQSTADADHLLELARSRTGWGVAERCYARTGTWAGVSKDWRTSKAHKPFYVDFSSAPSVAVLERAVARSEEDVVFEECLPDPLAPGVERVTENLLEITIGRAR